MFVVYRTVHRVNAVRSCPMWPVVSTLDASAGRRRVHVGRTVSRFILTLPHYCSLHFIYHRAVLERMGAETPKEGCSRSSGVAASVKTPVAHMSSAKVSKPIVSDLS